MASPLNSPQSLSPYPLDDDKRFQIVEAPVRLQYEQTRGSVYRSVSWIFGFREKYSLLNCVVWGGALVGFCLARSPSMNPERTPTVLPPDTVFSIPTFKINLFIHIYLSTIGGIFAVLQFLPVIRRKMVIIHRLNGYGVIFCLIVGNISGAIVARRSFGGEINAQSGYYILGLMIAFSGCMGVYNVKKDTRRHREWMLRMVVYFAAAVSGRLIMLAASEIITRIGTYYSVL
ncbi:hypothetical protein C8R43DRAFT_872881 [Mycena crocata]|nr:hypothetical protein C8R43DRAFT_872881 [Mycena crocata]